MRITYQGLPCLRAEISRAPGLAPGRGYVLIERKYVPEIAIRYNRIGIQQSRQVFWPVGAYPQPAESTAGTPPGEYAQNGALNFVGDLVFDSSDEAEGSGDNVVTIRRMYVDTTGIEEVDVDAFDGEFRSPVVKVNLVDSRAFWTTGGEVTGSYNRVMPAGTLEPGSMKKGTEFWSLRDFIEKAVSALPTSPLITHFDGEASATPAPLDEDWRPFRNPVVVFDHLLKLGGFTVGLHWDDTVGIYRENVTFRERTFIGASTGSTFEVPRRMVTKDSRAVRYNHHSILTRVWGKPIRVNTTATLFPVFTDREGKYRPLTDRALAAAGMTVGGQRATVENLARWVLRKVSVSARSDPAEKRFLEGAFRTFMIAPAALPEKNAVSSWDFDAAEYPTLPMLPYVARNKDEGGRPVELGFRVAAMTFYEQTFPDKNGLDQAIDQFVESIALEIQRIDQANADIDDQIKEIFEKLEKLGLNQDAIDILLSTPEEDLAAFYTIIEAYATLGEGTFPPKPENVGDVDETKDSIAQASLRNKQTFRLAVLVNSLRETKARNREQRDKLEEYLDRATANRSKLIDRAEFRKFFKLAYTAGVVEYPKDAYEVVPEKGIVVFNDPIFLLDEIGMDDIDGGSQAEPGNVWARIRYSYEMRTDIGTEYTNFLFAFDPASPGGVKKIGKNAAVAVAPVPIHDDRIAEYRNEDGKSIDPKFDESMEQAARQAAIKEFNVRRSEFARKYTFAHFWNIEAVPPVSNLVIGTDGDVSQTWVAVNDVEEPLLGYPSLRQAREKFNAVLAAMVERRTGGS